MGRLDAPRSRHAHPVHLVKAAHVLKAALVELGPAAPRALAEEVVLEGGALVLVRVRVGVRIRVGLRVGVRGRGRKGVGVG